FPPSYVILLPSASITHSHMRVSDNKWRSSITYYTVGSLFRWAAYRFQTERQLREQDPGHFKRIMDEREARWNDAINLFSKLEEL
ncbi:hypothetical protein EDB85DRAFT_1830903, partial [Lactarius pseudohatsudake]